MTLYTLPRKEDAFLKDERWSMRQISDSKSKHSSVVDATVLVVRFVKV
jgi:hypothetical protein